MITGRYKAGTTVAGQRVLFQTELFGRVYFWLEDGDGTTYLAKGKQNKDGVWEVDFT